MKDKEQAADGTNSISTSPLVFISHDSRDAELAEAFSKLLKSVSAGMIKTFRSSDKKAGEGIDFGEEWYKRLMTQLQVTSDVVCLFTERSLDRPWILFEAGVAKGKLETPVVGVALGVPLSRVSAGPFYQFQNMDDSEADLTKLVNQLARRVPGLELDSDVVQTQVKAFKATEASIVESLRKADPARKPPAEPSEEASVAKLIEEMKSLPSRIAERLFEDGFPPRRRPKRFHPMMFEELLHAAGEPGDPVGILLAASLVREDMPWLYELAMEVYRAVKSGDPEAAEQELSKLRRFSEVMLQGPFMEEFNRKEHHIMAMEFPRLLERTLRHALQVKRQPVLTRPSRTPPK
ncbi:MAG: hypothetical protein ACT4NL_11040 [Pseudomarimonas sp.]